MSGATSGPARSALSARGAISSRYLSVIKLGSTSWLNASARGLPFSAQIVSRMSSIRS